MRWTKDHARSRQRRRAATTILDQDLSYLLPQERTICWHTYQRCWGLHGTGALLALLAVTIRQRLDEDLFIILCSLKGLAPCSQLFVSHSLVRHVRSKVSLWCRWMYLRPPSLYRLTIVNWAQPPRPPLILSSSRHRSTLLPSPFHSSARVWGLAGEISFHPISNG